MPPSSTQVVPGAEPALKADLPRKSEDEQRDFFKTVMARSNEALAASGAIPRDLSIAGAILRLVFAGPELEAAFMPALAHLEVTETGEPDAVLHIWETGTTGVSAPPAPCNHRAFSERGDIWGFGSRRYRTAFHWSEFSLNVFDAQEKRGAFWIRSTEKMRYWTRASPLRTLLHWWMETRGGQLIHAAAVGEAETGAVLIVGKGGSGKSTTALSCLAAGLTYVADDYLAVTLDPPIAHSLYATAKVNVADAGRFAAFSPELLGDEGDEDQKAVMRLFPARATAVARSLPLRAIATPRFAAGAETALEPVSARTLINAASFTTLAQLPHSGDRTLAFTRRLVEVLPGVGLALGRAIDEVPLAIRQLLALPDDGIRAISDNGEAGPKGTQPLISVVIPVHNGAHFLAEAVASVLDQDHAAFEIIVIDDGSTDALAEAVGALPVEVRFIVQENRGPAAARNRGLAAASGALVAFLDVDDLWPGGAMSILRDRMLAEPELDVITGRGQLMERGPDGVFTAVGSPAESFPHYIGAALYRTSAFERAGGFDERLWFGEDTDWFLAADHAGLKVQRVDEVTLLVRRHETNMTRDRTLAEARPLRLARNILRRKREAQG